MAWVFSSSCAMYWANNCADISREGAGRDFVAHILSLFSSSVYLSVWPIQISLISLIRKSAFRDGYIAWTSEDQTEDQMLVKQLV